MDSFTFMPLSAFLSTEMEKCRLRDSRRPRGCAVPHHIRRVSSRHHERVTPGRRQTLQSGVNPQSPSDVPFCSQI